jgi:hypothetical protein
MLTSWVSKLVHLGPLAAGLDHGVESRLVGRINLFPFLLCGVPFTSRCSWTHYGHYTYSLQLLAPAPSVSVTRRVGCVVIFLPPRPSFRENLNKHSKSKGKVMTLTRSRTFTTTSTRKEGKERRKEEGSWESALPGGWRLGELQFKVRTRRNVSVCVCVGHRGHVFWPITAWDGIFETYGLLTRMEGGSLRGKINVSLKSVFFVLKFSKKICT